MDFLIYPPSAYLDPPFIRFSENFPSPLLFGPSRLLGTIEYVIMITLKFNRINVSVCSEKHVMGGLRVSEKSHCQYLKQTLEIGRITFTTRFA